MSDKSRSQQEFESLPEWAQKMVASLAGHAGCGIGGDSPLLSIMPEERRNDYTAFSVTLCAERFSGWWDGFNYMKALAEALTAPWPPPPALRHP